MSNTKPSDIELKTLMSVSLNQSGTPGTLGNLFIENEILKVQVSRLTARLKQLLDKDVEK